MTSEWIEFEDLYHFIREFMFSAAVESLCGTAILGINPTLTEDFWSFEDSVPTLFKQVPYWLAPRAHKARDKMLETVKKWHALANEYSDFNKLATEDPDWDPYFGSKYVKARQKLMQETGVIDADGRASEDTGLLFA